jgi:hypothetical protein
MKRVCHLLALSLTALVGSLLISSVARAQTNIAVFGNNDLITYINTLPGMSATLVSDVQLSTPGFLTPGNFSGFVYTRDGSSFGSSLSAAAAANVSAYVGGGNVVLFNSDIADGLLGDSQSQRLISNAVAYTIASGHGYIGELNGTAAALSSNGNGFTPLNLIAGSAGPMGFGGGGSDGSMVLTANGVGHPVTTGVSFPFNPAGVEFGADISGVNPSLVLANWDAGSQSPAIIAFAAVPEPGTLMLCGVAALSSGGVYWHRRLRRRKSK